MSCGACHRVLAKGDEMMGCKTCRHTVCRKCYLNPDGDHLPNFQT